MTQVRLQVLRSVRDFVAGLPMLNAIASRAKRRSSGMVLLFLTAALGAGQIHAGPLEGELFGYRLMDRYPVSSNTKWTNKLSVLAERPLMPDIFDGVDLAVTPGTFTIWSITGFARVSTMEDAAALERRYWTLFDQIYGSKCKGRRYRHDEGGEFICSGKYKLTTESSLFNVRIALGYHDESPEAKSIFDMIKKEDGPATQRRINDALNDAKAKGELRGLQ